MVRSIMLISANEIIFFLLLLKTQHIRLEYQNVVNCAIMVIKIREEKQEHNT